MIKIELKEPGTKAWKRWRAACQRKTQKLIALVAEGKAPKVDDRLYRWPSIRRELYFNKAGPFASKCAYCEKGISDMRDGELDHYRPKKGVTIPDLRMGGKDRPVFIAAPHGARVVHPGYYWLAYDWRNLLPVCKRCNQLTTVDGRSVGKLCRFPVIGKHATGPGGEAQEKPLLLNPVVDDPEAHLQVDSDTGVLVGRSRQGRTTVRVLGLNVRDRYPEERRKVIAHVDWLLDKLKRSRDAADQQRIVDELASILKGLYPFTLAARSYLSTPGIVCLGKVLCRTNG